MFSKFRGMLAMQDFLCVLLYEWLGKVLNNRISHHRTKPEKSTLYYVHTFGFRLIKIVYFWRASRSPKLLSIFIHDQVVKRDFIAPISPVDLNQATLPFRVPSLILRQATCVERKCFDVINKWPQPRKLAFTLHGYTLMIIRLWCAKREYRSVKRQASKLTHKTNQAHKWTLAKAKEQSASCSHTNRSIINKSMVSDV